MPSAAWPVEQALVAAIEGSAALDALLAGDKVYNSQAPSDSARPYVVVGDASERDFSAFSRRGTEGAVTLHLWADMPRKDVVLRIYDALHTLLHFQQLALTGHTMYQGALELVGAVPDADGRTIHGVARYTVFSRAG